MLITMVSWVSTLGHLDIHNYIQPTWALTRPETNCIRLYGSCYRHPLKFDTWALTQECVLAWDTYGMCTREQNDEMKCKWAIKKLLMIGCGMYINNYNTIIMVLGKIWALKMCLNCDKNQGQISINIRSNCNSSMTYDLIYKSNYLYS